MALFQHHPFKLGSTIALLFSSILIASCAHQKEESRTDTPAPTLTPNILLIVADDLAMGDLSFLGSEISTPTIDSLAETGQFFTQFYSGPTCAPSRAMLLTGVDTHSAGMGVQGGAPFVLPEEFEDHPAYLGHLNDRVVTVASRLRAEGYETFMAGKWHLGEDGGDGPHMRGFDQSIMMEHGGGSHFENVGHSPRHPRSDLVENGEVIKYPADYYSTDFYTETLIGYIDQAAKTEAPFFGYAAYTAPHWPLQAPQEAIQSLEPVYQAGWDRLREQRFAKQVSLGLIDSDTPLSERWLDVPAWESLSMTERREQAKIMATYAAMTEHLDRSINRLLEALENSGQLENTIVIFLSDNGAAAEDLSSDLPDGHPWREWINENYPATGYESIGSENNWSALGRPWAQLGSVHLSFHKNTLFEGGVRVPLIIRDFRGPQSSEQIDTPWVITGITPTILEWAGISDDWPEEGILPPSGPPLSLLSASGGEAATITYVGLGDAMIRKGDWKLVRSRSFAGATSFQLFNLSQDPGEQIDLSAQHPSIRDTLMNDLETYEAANGILKLPEGWNLLTGAKAN